MGDEYFAGGLLLAGADELLDLLLAANEGVIDDGAEEEFELLAALLDELGVFVGLLPEVGPGELGDVVLIRAGGTLQLSRRWW